MVPGSTYGDLIIARVGKSAAWSPARQELAAVCLARAPCGSDLRRRLVGACARQILKR
jgi:hypothetical protein